MNKQQVISDITKAKVMERQRNRSISGVYLTPGNVNFHHFKSVGSGGVGYEWNVVALTPLEHRQLHDGADITVNGRKRYTNAEFKTLIRNHFILRYDGWSEMGCKVKKGKSEEDYGITRISGNKTAASRSTKIKTPEYDGGC